MHTFARSTTVGLLVTILSAGCSGMPKEKTAREQGYEKWNTTRAAVLFSLAKQNYESGNLEACRKAIDDAAKLNPKDPEVHVLSAKVYIEQGSMESAQKELVEALKTDPKNAEAEYLSGVVFQRWQRPQAALESYTRASEKNPNELAYVLARAETMVELDQRDAALALLQDRVNVFENSGTIRDAVGQLLVQQGRFAEAVPVLRQATILAPEETIIREHLALATFYAKQWREASELLTRVLKEDRNGQRADLLSALGECQLEQGKFREARESFESAAQINPSSPAVWLGLAKAAMQLNDTKRVELSLKKAAALDTRSTEALILQGYLRIKQDKLPEALSAFRRASAIDPDDTLSLCMSGYVLEKLGRQNEAIACYARALKMKPGDDLASALMAQVRVDE